MSFTLTPKPKDGPDTRRAYPPTNFGGELFKKPPKLTYRASPDERKRALWLVDMYRHMTGNEKNENWLDVPADELGEDRYRRAGRYLVNMLQRFAADGTFADTADARPEFARLMAGGMRHRTYEAKIAVLAQRFNVSEATAARWLRKPALSKRAAE